MTTKTAPAPAAAPPAQPRRFSINPRQSGIYVAFALIVVLFAVLTDGALLQPQNISNIIVQNSYVLILDEPTRGIDVGAKYEIYSIINDLAAQGRAVLVISSELPELLGLCDRIYALSEGRITGEVDRAEATQERLMQYMTRGQNS